MGVLRPVEVGAKLLWINASWSASKLVAARLEPSAAEFYRRIEDQAFQPHDLIRVLPDHRLIYLVVPKAASTRIRETLAAVRGHYSRRLNPRRWGRLRGPQGPLSMTVRSFYRLAADPTTLRFSFVRNPYTRLLSCWADKFQDSPLIPGAKMFNDYLELRGQIDKSLPEGPDRTLSFPQFVRYATAIANARRDPHIQLQDDILSVPGIPLDLLGRVESFNEDFAPVLDHMRASDQVRHMSIMPLNQSRRGSWADYYSSELANTVYRAYERDFDRFKYPRALPG